MPKLNNKYGLPEPIVRAILNDPYDSGDCDISTTRLISPPQKVALMKRHGDDIEVDVSERIWSLLGQAIHVILERAAGDEIVERRYFAERLGWKVSGAVDLINGGTVLTDWKVTSAWTYVYGSRTTEWTAQANINRWLYAQNGGTVYKLQNILFLRDWTKKEIRGKYPPVQIATVDLKMWSLEETERYVLERVKLHQEAQKLPDDALPSCTDEERWWNERRQEFINCAEYCDARTICQQNLKGASEDLTDEKPF